jgi:predicted site-specific integrase-resolvase
MKQAIIYARVSSSGAQENRQNTERQVDLTDNDNPPVWLQTGGLSFDRISDQWKIPVENYMRNHSGR